MPREVVNRVPDFDSEDTTPTEPKGNTEVKETPAEEVGEEKETPSEPSAEEKPAEEEPKEETLEEPSEGEDAGEQPVALKKQLDGLAHEKELLLKEIQDLRGQRRTIKEEEVKKVDAQIDELKDLHPEDIKVIDRILKAKGYMSKEEFSKTLYDTAQQEELDSFMQRYPEFKPENDKNDINWNALRNELKDYQANKTLPLMEFRGQVKRILEKARKSISGQAVASEPQTQARQKVKTAGVGSGGKTGSSPSKSFTPERRSQLERGGFSEEEIKDMESSL